MGLSNYTHLHLQIEGIMMIEDLCDFAKAGSWTHILENCKYPPKVMVANVLVNQPAFQLPAKSLMRLKVSAQAVEYYLDTGWVLSAS